MIHRIEIVNDQMIEICHAFQDDCDPVQTNVNIFVACFTTSYARLELYNALDILQQRVLYFDTDSIIYTQKPAESLKPLRKAVDKVVTRTRSIKKKLPKKVKKKN